MLFLLSNMERSICLSVSLQCGIFYTVCLNLGFIAVKRYHDQGNSYKAHLIEGKFRGPVYYHQGRKNHSPSRHGAGGDESSTS